MALAPVLVAWRPVWKTEVVGLVESLHETMKSRLGKPHHQWGESRDPHMIESYTSASWGGWTSQPSQDLHTMWRNFFFLLNTYRKLRSLHFGTNAKIYVRYEELRCQKYPAAFLAILLEYLEVSSNPNFPKLNSVIAYTQPIDFLSVCVFIDDVSINADTKLEHWEDQYASLPPLSRFLKIPRHLSILPHAFLAA